MNDAVKIMSQAEYLLVEIAQQKLEQAGIPAFIMDKRDSSYPGILGHVELYVDRPHLTQAKSILEQEKPIDK